MRLQHIFGGVAISVALTAIAPAAAVAATSTCVPDAATVCIETTDTPESVSPSTPASPRYIAYGATITNRQQSSATHLTMRYALPAGTALSSVTADAGTCSDAGGTVTCDLGRLESGARRTVDLVIVAPGSSQTIASEFVVTFDERTNDGPAADPKQDTVRTTETTDVVATPGVASSYVPAGTALQLSTDPTGANDTGSKDLQLGSVSIPARENALTAELEETPDAGFTCPKGYVCRAGDWLRAAVPGTYGGVFGEPLRFFLRWDKALITRGQNTKNFAVLHTADLETFGAEEWVGGRCSSSTPVPVELPCLWNVRKEKDGDYSALLITTHNGYMR